MSHDVLLQKLKNIGSRYSVVNWFESYLTNRKQVTVAEDVVSSMHISCGVPQGSILGPLLFICYINDLAQITTFTQPFIYADDTTLLCKGTDVDEIRGKLHHDLAVLQKWFVVNKLSLSIDKTKLCYFVVKE